MKNNTKTITPNHIIVVVVVFAIMVVSGLAVVPLMNEADAAVRDSKNRGVAYDGYGDIFNNVMMDDDGGGGSDGDSGGDGNF